MTAKQPDGHHQWVLDAVENYERRLVAYACSLLGGDINGAHDVVQHAFIQLCDQSPADIGSRLPAWLFTVCRNRALDELRRRGRYQTAVVEEMVTVGPTTEPTCPADEAELQGFVQSLIQKLPPSEREAIDLWSHGFRYAEISEITGKRASSVRVFVHRAIHKLKADPTVQSWLEEFDTTAAEYGEKSKSV